MQDSLTKRHTSIVVVIREPKPELNFGHGQLSLIVTEPEIRQEANSIVVSSMANQFQMIINPIRIQFTDKSEKLPARKDFAERVVKLVDWISQSNKIDLSSLGLNFDLILKRGESNRASEYIRDRFVNAGIFATTGYKLIGASVRLWYMARGIRHYLYIEPLGNSYDAEEFYAHINVHYKQPTPFNSSWLTTAIMEEYKDFRKVLSTVLTVDG